MDNTSLIFRSIPPNGQKYIEEKLGRLLNTAMIQFITDGKKMGDYDKFLQDNDLVEEKEYHFIKTDEEPSSPVTKTEGFPSFDDPSGKLVDIINTIRSKEEEDKSKPEKVIPTQKYLQKKRKAVFSNPADVLGQDSSFVAPKYDKSESEGNKIKAALMNNMLTKKLSVEAVNTLIGAMQSRSYKKGDVIIQFGEEGKEYFILDSGV